MPSVEEYMEGWDWLLRRAVEQPCLRRQLAYERAAWHLYEKAEEARSDGRA